MGERITPSTRGGGFAGLDILDDWRIDVQREQRLQRRVAVGFGAGGVGLGLLFLAAGNALMLEQVLVHIGQAAGIAGGGQRLAIGADGGGEIGR